MLVASILPMPSLDPQRYVALYLTNPLLLAVYPEKMRATAERLAGGQYDKAATAALAQKLHEKRKYVVLHAAVEANDPEGERELLELADHPRIGRRERVHLREKIFGARPSEYAWLRGPIEATIKERAAALEMQQAQLATAA